MTDLKKAEDLYLRGFNGNYIKNETGITIQSLLGNFVPMVLNIVKKIFVITNMIIF